MPKHTKLMIEKCNHPLLKQPQDTPFYPEPIVHGLEQQTTKVDTSKPLLPKDTKLL